MLEVGCVQLVAIATRGNHPKTLEPTPGFPRGGSFVGASPRTPALAQGSSTISVFLQQKPQGSMPGSDHQCMVGKQNFSPKPRTTPTKLGDCVYIYPSKSSVMTWGFMTLVLPLWVNPP